MIDHISIGTHQYAKAVEFYSQVLAPLDMTLLRDTGSEAAFGKGEQWMFFLYPVSPEEAITANGAHIAFGASSRQVVEAIHASALAASANDILTPRTRPDISPSYYGAMFMDLDGHRIEVKTDAAT